jgi:hypothetical protein
VRRGRTGQDKGGRQDKGQEAGQQAEGGFAGSNEGTWTARG